jgi:hypothetical protein
MPPAITPTDGEEFCAEAFTGIDAVDLFSSEDVDANNSDAVKAARDD